MSNSPFQPLYGGKNSDKSEEMVNAFNELRAKGAEVLKQRLDKSQKKTARVSKPETGPVVPQRPFIPARPVRSLAGNELAGLLKNKKMLALLFVILLIFIIVAILMHRQKKQQDNIKDIAKQLKKMKRLK